MALSPKQIAAKAVFHNLPKFLEMCRNSTADFAEGRTAAVKASKAREQVDNIAAAFVAKMEKLTKRKLGKSVAEQIDEADAKDGADF